MKFLVVHTYIPSEKCNQYPKEIDSVLCDDFKKALAIARKQLAAERETYEVDDCEQCVSYEEDDSLYLECCGGLDWWHIYFIKE